MVLDFDVKTFCQNLKATKPPYECPVKTCRKVYKSFSGIQFHMHNHDHDSPDSPGTGAAASPAGGSRKPGHRRSRSHHWNPRHVRQQRPTSTPEPAPSPPRETISYVESQRLVEIDFDGCLRRIDISQPLELISQDEIDNQDNIEKEEKNSGRPKRDLDSKVHKDKPAVASLPPDINPKKLPEPKVTVLDEYVKPKKITNRSSSYYRYVEKSVDELDEEVEYDMDEEDHVWLELVNEKRTSEGVAGVAQDVFETIMDRFEKEAFFQAGSGRDQQGPPMDDDAVCNICMDGECQNSNMILFCDMCNLAVHQECYGVPYIPEGQWLCRRCLQSPSKAVECCLCPNKGGAFKQTDDGRWAHVVCALWIPEVGFANTVFLEPIDCLQRIPPARRRLTCYICKQRGHGAAIQCHKPNCYTAFHVTCAQQAGLFMKIEAIKEPGPNGVSVGVRKTAFCDVHGQASSDNSMYPDEDDEKSTVNKEEAKEQSRLKLIKARRLLAKKRNSLPNVAIPIIPEPKVNNIARIVDFPQKEDFMRTLMSYWTLKRQSRFGVPLLRRLQSNQMSRSREQSRNDKQNVELREQLKYWQRLRQDLEKARLLCELIRKREKLKRELLRVYQQSLEFKLQPFSMLLRTTLNQLQERDTEDLFADPVTEEEAPDYKDVIKKPMCFAVMRQKVDTHRYKSMESFEADFKLIIHNCCTYNAKDTVFYKEAKLLKEEGLEIIRDAKKEAELSGFECKVGLHADSSPSPTAKKQKKAIKEESGDQAEGGKVDQGLDNQLKALQAKMERCNKTMKGGNKQKVLKKLRTEIAVIRRKIALAPKAKGKKSKPAARKNLNKKKEPEKEKQETEDSVKDEVTSGDEKDDSFELPPLIVETESGVPVTPTPGSVKKGRGRYTRSPSVSPAAASTPASQPKTASGRGGRGRGRGRGGRGRTASYNSSREETPKRAGDRSDSVKSSKESPPSSRASSKDNSQSKAGSHTPSPAGVNRRTAVLFNSKKGRSTPVPNASSTSPASSASSASTAKKGAGRGAKTRQTRQQDQQQLQVKLDESMEASDDVAPLLSPPAALGPKSPTGRKRSASQARQHSEPPDLTAQPTPAKKSTNGDSGAIEAPGSIHIGGPDITDNFKSYRNRGHQIRSSSESDTSDELSSGDESISEHSSDSSGNRSPCERRRSSGLRDGPEGSDLAESTEGASPSNSPTPTGRGSRRSPSLDSDDLTALEPLDLVWAKCRGYPWYPALIINPKMPKTGYFHNGVPIPVPPDEVLELQTKYNDSVYLVLFFDTKRTWQWLARNKLEPLGVNSDLDKSKLMENKKPNVRNAVKKAYEKAIIHRCRVRGDPNPLSDDSSSDNNQ